MNRVQIGFVFIILLLACPGVSFSLSVTAQVDKTDISIQDSISLKLIVDGGSADVDISAVKDFKIHSRGRSSSYQFINGEASHQVIFQYVLFPVSKGEFVIPAIKVSSGKKEAYTKPITITVSDQVVNADVAKALFAEASTSASTLYAGQQAVYTIKFYTSKRLGGLAFETRPDFKGLSVKPFDKEKNYSLNINGIPYNVTRVDYLIIPSSAGEVTIDPAVFIAKVLVKSQDPMFDSFFSSTRQKAVRVVSNAVSLNVLDLPAYEGTIPFSGLVGDFEINGSIDKNKLNAGESATFTIQIIGMGNIMDAGLPEIDFSSMGFKVYDDNPVEDLSLTEKGYQGSKTFKKAIVPVQSGKYSISPVRLVYFDIEQKAYKMMATSEIELDVLATDTQPVITRTAPDGKTAPVVKEEVSLENKDILDIKEGLSVLEDYKPMDGRFFALFLSLPAIFFLCFRIFFQFKQQDLPAEKIMQDKAREHLKQAVKAGSGNTRFLGHLYSALMASILARGKKQAESVTMNEAKMILEDSPDDKQQADEALQAFKTLEAVRFGGERIDEQKANGLLAIVKQMVTGICLVLTCLIAMSLTPQRVEANVTTDFTDGIKHYKAGRFLKAASSWELIVEKSVRNPYLYYNIGNAYLKADDIGRAILWYERARILSPNDPDLNFNLAHARTLVIDKKQERVHLLDIIFFWDSFMGDRVIQITSICMSVIFFAWAGFRSRKQTGIFTGTGVLLCAVLVLVTSIAMVNYYKQSLRQEAVIVAPEVHVRSGTASEATILFTLHAGTMVNVEQVKDNDFKISFSKDMVGWLKQSDAILVHKENRRIWD